MNVKSVMVRTPAVCSPETNLGVVAEILWNRNCGILPMIDVERRVKGVVTDRDVAIAMGTRNRLPGEITAKDVASGVVYACKAEDAITTALDMMAEKKVRRLVVVNDDGKLEGILSMDDIVLHAAARTGGKFADLPFETVVQTLRAIYAPQLPQVARAAVNAE